MRSTRWYEVAMLSCAVTALEPQGRTRRHRNGHLLELQSVEWRCLHCLHWFDAAVDADAFWCGEPCARTES